MQKEKLLQVITHLFTNHAWFTSHQNTTYRHLNGVSMAETSMHSTAEAFTSSALSQFGVQN